MTPGEREDIQTLGRTIREEIERDLDEAPDAATASAILAGLKGTVRP